MTEPAKRFVIAQSWWIASELARRHPGLTLIETHPADGMYDCLTLVDHRGPATKVDLNREGRLHPGGATGPTTWSDAVAAPDGHEVVKLLERTAKLVPLSPAPPTTPKTLVYRMIARVLTSLVDDRHDWDARNGQLDGSDSGGGTRGELSVFPSVVDGLRDRRVDDLFDIPAYRYWIILRDTEPLAVLDIDGRLHQPKRPPVSLPPIYRKSGSSLTAAVGSTMGHLLP